MRDAQFRVRAVKGEPDDALAHREARHVRSDAHDGAGALVAHDVGNADQRSAQSIQRVTAFDADDLDAHEHLAETGNRVGDLFVAKDTRGTVLVIDRGFIVLLIPASSPEP